MEKEKKNGKWEEEGGKGKRGMNERGKGKREGRKWKRGSGRVGGGGRGEAATAQTELSAKHQFRGRVNIGDPPQQQFGEN